jgi:hypothetical protein
MLTSEEVAAGVAALGSAFRRRVSAETTLIYHRVLHEKLDSKQFQAAIREIIEKEEEFPTVSKIIDYGDAVPRATGGTPHVHGMPLSDYLDRVREGDVEG